MNRMFLQSGGQGITSATLPDSKNVTDYQPLLDLQDKCQFVQVDALNQHHTQSYQSMIVKLDFVYRAIYLDALTPINPYYPVVVGDTLTIKHHDHGKILLAKGELLDIVTDNNELFYVMSLPEEIGFKQRRFYRRLNVVRNEMLKLRLWSPIRIPWYARVTNISAGGARLSVGGNVCRQLKVGTQLPNCDIELDSGQKFCCKATVKAFRFQRRPYEHTEISIEFNGLKYQQKNWLLQWVEFCSQSQLGSYKYC